MKGTTKFILFFLFLIIIVFIFFGDKMTISQKLHSTLFKEKPIDWIKNKLFSKDNNIIINDNTSFSMNIIDTTWCEIKNLQVSNDFEQPINDSIVGWDSQNLCCRREIYGYNCALQKFSLMTYCFTANIGGEVKYIKIDENIVTGDYIDFLYDIDKQYIPNKPCNVTKYGG